MMAYTETSSKSWFDRLGNAFRGIGVGIFLLIAGTILLWWNEGDFVNTGDALREAQAVTQELGDISKLDPSKKGKLVHATGQFETKDMLGDPIFGVSVNAIRLERSVQFYQWIERSKSTKRQKLGGGEETVTTYTYEAAWRSNPVNSSTFKDPKAQTENRNFVLANMDSFTAQATNVTFGAYRLPGFMISSIGGAIPLNVTLSKEILAKLNKNLAVALKDAGRPAPGAETQMVHVSGNTVLLSASPTMPQIGDVRVTFKESPPAGTVSILGTLIDNTFGSYSASNGKTVGTLFNGAHSLENMYAGEHSSNAMWTWILRAVGTLLIVLGLSAIVAPLGVLASVIPLLGSIVGAGTGIVALLLGLAWSLVIISIAWLRFRPLIGGAMLAVAVILIALLYFKGRSRKAATK